MLDCSKTFILYPFPKLALFGSKACFLWVGSNCTWSELQADYLTCLVHICKTCILFKVFHSQPSTEWKVRSPELSMKDEEGSSPVAKMNALFAEWCQICKILPKPIGKSHAPALLTIRQYSLFLANLTKIILVLLFSHKMSLPRVNLWIALLETFPVAEWDYNRLRYVLIITEMPRELGVLCFFFLLTAETWGEISKDLGRVGLGVGWRQSLVTNEGRNISIILSLCALSGGSQLWVSPECNMF